MLDRINVVSPGASATTMSLRPGESEAERVARVKHELPLGRVSATDEVAAAVLYLASDGAASIVGTDLVIDSGGSLCTEPVDLLPRPSRIPK